MLPPLRDVPKDHPRGCGDKGEASARPVSADGSPPRMRGQVCGDGTLNRRIRITPADAGTSCATEGNEKREKDHPRGCGDKRQRHCYVLSPVGSPPRMRGQGGGRMDKSNKTGITPADAGTRPRIGQCFPVSQDHPRGCGDKFILDSRFGQGVGSPPRMRGQVEDC